MSDPAARPNISDAPGIGATVETVYVRRQVKAYAVFETEVASISTLNAQATVFFSVASGLVSFAIGIWTNAAFSEKLTAAGEVAGALLAPILLVGGLVFFGLGVYAWRKRRSEVDEIRSQSQSSIGTS